jgi:hypothetical protein
MVTPVLGRMVLSPLRWAQRQQSCSDGGVLCLRGLDGTASKGIWHCVKQVEGAW